MGRSMRIGLFTDTYRPSINGIVYVVESLKKHLEAQGHEVFIFCPASSIRPSQQYELLNEDEEHIIRFPSIKGPFFDDYDTSLFVPPAVLGRIRDINLDVIHFFTPSQVGMMGVYAAYRTGTPLVAQHCTDLRLYVEHYKDGTLLPGLLALIALLPFAMKFNGKDIRELVRLYRPRSDRVQWNIDIVEHAVTLIYSKCDAVIALSQKSKKQLESWQDDDYRYEVTLMPNGVDKLKSPSRKHLKEFREQWGVGDKDEVFGFVGRLGAEKNLDILLLAFDMVAAKRPRAKLMFVGDFEYRETLEQKAAASPYGDRVIFTGAWPREDLGVVYAAMDVFVFPSLTDTQGWAVHEAALAGLPLVLIDKDVSEVLTPRVNGEFAENNPENLAGVLVGLLSSPKKRKSYGKESQKLARRFTEKNQVKKLAKLYEKVVVNYGERHAR
jgi:1,2-diacylglycerol 3-alpha-glucosyltransferase